MPFFENLLSTNKPATSLDSSSAAKGAVGNSTVDDSRDLKEPLINPLVPPGGLKKVPIVMDSNDPKGATPMVISKRQGSVRRSGEFLSHNTKRKGSVLSKLFEVQSRGLDLERPNSVSKNRKIKSFIFTILNPRSRQAPATYFKWLILFVIVVDFVFFVASTEPYYRRQNLEIFHFVEGVTSSIFLMEYLGRLYVVTESKRYGHLGPWWGRLRFIFRWSALVDLLATLPFFLELGTNWVLPTLTFLQAFRLLRILKASGFVQATDAVRRVIYYNREIMYMSVFVGLFMILTTSVLMFYLRPRNDYQSDDFESMLSTMYLSTLILTGSTSVGDLPELPWYTKGVVLLTSTFSIGMFAIPVSMLTWGFEAEAERVAKRSRQLAKRQLKKQDESYDGGSSSTDDYSTDEEYQRIIAAEDSDSEEDETQQAILQFLQTDTDGSGHISLKEHIEMTRQNRTHSRGSLWPAADSSQLEARLDTLERKVDNIAEKVDKLCQALAAASTQKKRFYWVNM